MGDVRRHEATRPIKLGLVGIGKIARDQHVPAIAGSADFMLAATADPVGAVDDVPAHADIAALIAGGHDLAAVALCTPPRQRAALAHAAIAAGLHVLLEKPPGATVEEVAALVDHAERRGVTVFAAWHSREAAAVDAARAWLDGQSVRSVRIDWREDIRRWHPGQEWILAAEGFGVFDPGINALSIITAVLPGTWRVEGAMLQVPLGRAAPIAASLDLLLLDGTVPVTAAFDFLQTGPQCWDITIETDGGTLVLQDGGKRLVIDGVATSEGPDTEYARLYARFADLIARGASDVDVAPLRLVADALRLGTVAAAPAFTF